MSGLGWRLRRLRAMRADELLHRVRIAVRDRWFAPAWTRLSPGGAHAALFRRERRLFAGAAPASARARHARDLERAARWLPGPEAALLPAADRDALRAHAAAIARGEWSCFGHTVALGDPVDWNANALSGERWPDAPSRAIDYRRTDVAGGAKYAWELGRLTLLPDLAIAARLGDDDAGARARALLQQWNARNPLGHGIHHTSGIEMAIRVATVSATLALLGASEERPAGGGGAFAPGSAPRLDDVLEPALGLVAQQALWCRDHLSLGSSANNHLLSEYMAMAIAGGAWPSLRGAERLARAGREGLQRECLLQFHADGVNGEQAFGYLPFVWELLLLGLRGADAAGLEPSRAVRERLAASLEFARAIRDAGGGVPQVGDEDDGRILLASLPGSRLDLVGNALAAWLGVDALSDEAPGYALALGFAPRAARAARDGAHEFPEGGWTVWRERGLRVTFDHGPLGLGVLAAHGHADALSVTLALGTDALVIDPGTLAYHEDEAARATSRGTPAHATAHFGGRSQSEMLGPFLWGRRADVTAEGGAWRCRWWSGETHVRAVTVADGRVTLDDRVEGRDPELVFPLAPGAIARLEGGRAIVESGRARAVFTSEGAGPWRLEPGECAPRFAQRTPAQRLVAALPAGHARTTIHVTAAGA